MSVSEKDVRSYFTPYKYGKPILEPSGEEGAFDQLMVDNMRICRHNGKFYCFYIGFNGKGYQTALAVSEDLLHWEKKGVVLPAGSGRAWDTNGRAISCLLCDIDLYGNRELIKIDGKYWMFYHAYPGEGYETGAAANGIAWSTDEELLEWHCEEEPVFSKGESGCWDGAGLYSTWVFPRDGKYVMYYNGKDSARWPWHEQVGMAFSDDFYNWKRYKDNPVLKVTPDHWDSHFSCGQHVLYDSREKRWVMFYVGLNSDGGWYGPCEGVAISDDGIHWGKYEHPIIIPGKSGWHLENKIKPYHAVTNNSNGVKNDLFDLGYQTNHYYLDGNYSVNLGLSSPTTNAAYLKSYYKYIFSEHNYNSPFLDSDYMTLELYSQNWIRTVE